MSCDERPNLSGAVQEINNWGAIYDEAYATQNAANADPSLNFSGYDNSYTPRVPHQIPVVREWVETTCERIAALHPRRALEMGAGQGMIMLRVAQVARELYIACDLSQFSVAFCKEILESDARFHLPHVRRPLLLLLATPARSISAAYHACGSILGCRSNGATADCQGERVRVSRRSAARRW